MRAAAKRGFPARQGIAVIGRNKRTTLVTSMQELLDRMKRRKFSMHRLPFVREVTPEPPIPFRLFAICGAGLPRRLRWMPAEVVHDASIDGTQFGFHFNFSARKGRFFDLL